MVPQAQAQAESKDCYREILLLSGSCTVTYTCPPTASSCIANGEVNVQAVKVTGIVRGEVFTVINPAPAGNDGAVTASCGAPQVSARRCATQTQFIGAGPGDQIHVACHANRHFPTLGILTTEIFCRGNFAAFGGT